MRSGRNDASINKIRIPLPVRGVDAWGARRHERWRRRAGEACHEAKAVCIPRRAQCRRVRWRARRAVASASSEASGERLQYSVASISPDNSSSIPRRPPVKGRRTAPAPALKSLVESASVTPKERLLCFGCGAGADVEWLRRMRFDVTGYDRHPDYAYTEAPEGHFDVVFMIYLLRRIPGEAQRRERLAEALGYLRPGGRLIIISRELRGLAGESGAAPHAAALAYVCGLMPQGMAEPAEELTPGDAAAKWLCLSVRRSGTLKPSAPVTVIEDAASLAGVCARLSRAPFVGLDVETTLDEPRVLCTVQLGIPGQNWIIDALALNHELEPLKALMENGRVAKVIHNALFEEQVLGRYGIRINNIFDTLTASRKKHKRGVRGGHRLDEVCERELKVYLDKTEQTSDWTQRPLTPRQIAYAALDAEVLVTLYARFNPPPPPENLTLF